ncbi:leucine-rich repeat and IQ domain-containing protein 1-like [Crassostrea angulata]|uniref:leucine-rich repeat and IQ domain-containing protein 1-like n=1 Tax=Magallana angulata TaxID=2784310 RepID=UPI0022B0DF62|nr:leucine-rich repeat and IQ domain-containing protein 1-like [Crassostrea angulata]XP_052676992.1 leucine-rich repeat and IQ domain-containing protein 1-like [Crassostrea angulata]
MKSMPPSGALGVTMDDDALIEAEIAQQLDQINLEADDFQFDENEVDFQDDDLDFPLEDQEVVLPAEMSDYINQIQRQASDFEKELAECDELIQHQTPGPKTLLNEDELSDLEQLARERGVSPETYRKRVLEEEEDFTLTDYSTLVSDDKDQQTDANDNSMALVHLNERQLEFQKIFQENLRKMEETQKQREERLQREIQEDKKREWDDFEEKEKKWMDKFASLQKEETQLVAERKMQQEKFEIELKDKENQFERELKYYEEEIKKLETETKQEQEQLDLERSEELKRQEVKQQTSATKIQAGFRGYRVRKLHRKTLDERREERAKNWEEERVKEVEEEIQRQKEEDRLKRVKEEEEEKEKIEEEARRKAEEVAKKKAEEEAKKKEEEAKRKAKEEEAKRKAEEEEAKRKAKEEAKKKAEEEAKRKTEEEMKKKAEEEAKRKADEEAKKKAEEAKKKAEEEAKRKAEEEAKRKAEEEEARKSAEEAKKRLEEEEKKKAEEMAKRKAEEEIKKSEEEAAKKIAESAREEAVVESKEKKNVLRKSQVRMSQETSGSPRPKSARSRPKSAAKRSEDLDIFDMDDTKKLQTSAHLLQGLPENLEKLRLQWIKECMPWSKVSNEPWKLKTGTSKSMRRPTSAKKLQALSEDTILMAARVSTLRQVTTVELRDLPGCNISTLGQCWGLKTLKMSKCNLTVVEGLQQCKQLHYLDLQDNFIQYVDLKDLSNLTFLDLSHNSLSSIHGLSGCSNLRWLDLSKNKITRIGGTESLRRLHTLKLSHNQLISTTGLNDTPTLQMIDMSSNHLQMVEDVSKLCLLQSLMVSSNNLQKLPCLRNHVLMRVLCLDDNSITNLEDLQCDWLPLLEVLNLSQNSIEDLVPLNNLLILKHLDISHNQILEVESVSASVTKCVHLESLSVAGNPFTELTNLDLSLPSLKRIDERVLGSGGTEVKPRTSFEAMCLSQTKVYTELANSLLQDVGAEKSKLPLDLGALCDLYFKYCDTTQKLAEEHRYAHEYGEITMAVPTAPSTPKSSQRPPSSKSVRQAQRESHLLNPKEMFERAVKTSEKGNKEGETAMNGESLASLSGSMDGRIHAGLNEKKPPNLTAKAVKALVDEDFGVSHSSEMSDLQNVAATKIQACWRGHRVRRRIWGTEVMGQGLDEVDQEILRELHQAATKIQAVWRGYILRVRLEQALEFAKFEDEDDFDFQEVDLKDLNFNEEMLEDWKPPPTPQLPANHPVLGKPPIGKLSSPPGKIPSLNLGDKPQPPGNPRRAWRGMDSPLSEAPQNGHVPRPPSIVSATDTHRTAMSKKEEQISEEWGFRDANTAHVMMQRAKKLKYNAERRKKLGKLDPKQRLALFRRLEETNVTRKPVSQPSRQTLPRKEYFQARQEEIEKQDLEKRVMANLRNSRTFEWLHNQVGSFEDQEPHLQHHPQPQPHSVKLMRQMYDNNLPRLDPQGGRNNRLTGSPAMDLQSVDSVSLQGEMIQPPRRFSAGSEASSGARFPPIKTNSAGSGQKRERISFRDNEVKLGIGWGGGRKRGQRM